MVDSGRVPIRYVEYLLDQAVRAGCDRALLEQSIHLNAAIEPGSQECSSFTYGKLYQRIMRETNDEWFAMFAGGKVPLGAFRLMCLAATQCTDFRQALVRCGEFAEICRGLHVKTLIIEFPTQTRLRFGPLRSQSEREFIKMQNAAEPSHILMSLFASHRFNCWLVGRELPLEEVLVSFASQDSVFDLTMLKTRKLLTSQPVNELVYSAGVLELPIVQSRESAFEFARTAPYHLITVDPAQLTLVEKVRNILNRDVSSSMPSADEVASMLHMSGTTLRRRLMAENAAFQALKDECRLEAALHYLNCPDLTNTMVAEKLGFDEPSAFFRAFKKWTGETPGGYRARVMASSDPQ